ncbi:hypothetical protein [uncultured Clostridium sp.]|uniref:hypothetical protein n=1 Tax=uncultured Clostridium sp. TaxID=59620 RepID=UPI00272B84CF|nr:hypothetical protein [uncultured Clostridium sp.]
MISKNKIIISSVLVSTILLGASVTTFASTSNGSLNNSIESIEKGAKVKWKGTAYLSKGNWCNVTSSNNIFPDSPKVTNYGSNPSTIKVRILNSNGAQVGETKSIAPGQTVRLDRIPAFSGTYTLQACPDGDSGYYTISID